MEQRREELQVERNRILKVESELKLNEDWPVDADTEVLSFVVTPGLEVCDKLIE